MAICGHSGAGKTTLIERLTSLLTRDGRRVAVLKRTHHDVAVDVAGKDSDRCFRAGATVCLQAPGELFVRRAVPPRDAEAQWRHALAELAASHDVVLVEGHKQTPLPKIWLLGPGEANPPAHVANVQLVLTRTEPRPERALALLRGWPRFDAGDLRSA